MFRYQVTSAVLTTISCVALMIAFVLHIISFSTWDWLVSDGYSPFIEIGFFEACFDECKRPYCPGGDDELILDGCYSLWEWFQNDYHVQEIWYWLTPDWFLTCRTLVVVNIPLIALCMFALIFCTLLFWREQISAEPMRNRQIFIYILQVTAAIFAFVTALMAIFSVCIFYTNAFRRDWMPMEYKNSLGYSFWLEVVCAVLLTVSALITTVAALLKAFRTPYERGIHYADDMYSTKS